MKKYLLLLFFAGPLYASGIYNPGSTGGSTGLVTVSSATAGQVGYYSSSTTISGLSTLTVSGSTTVFGGQANLGSNKITSLANATSSTDAAAYGQVGMFRVVCSSVTNDDLSTTGGSFVPSSLGCSGALINASHHAFVIATFTLGNTTSGNDTEAALFIDGVNQDDSSQGGCQIAFSIVAGFTLGAAPCTLQNYYAPGDTSTHAFRVYFGNSGGTQQFRGVTQRMTVFEVM